MGNAVED